MLQKDIFMVMKYLSQFNAIPAKVGTAYPLGVTKSLNPGRYPRLKPESPNIVFTLLGLSLRVDIDRLDFLEMKGLLVRHEAPERRTFQLNKLTLESKKGAEVKSWGALPWGRFLAWPAPVLFRKEAIVDFSTIAIALILIYVLLTLCLPIFVFQILGELRVLNRSINRLIEIQGGGAVHARKDNALVGPD